MDSKIFTVAKRKTVNTIRDAGRYVKKNHIARKANNTLKQINSVATPALAAASVVQPELAPVFGAVGSGLKAAEAGYAIARKHFK